MISKIRFKNYKAFEEGEIEFKPITILLGANSVGKSSILNLLLMLKQTAECQDYLSPLKLNGEYVQMGEPQNLFRRRDISKPFILEFELNPKNFREIITDDCIFYIYRFLSRYISADRDFDYWGRNFSFAEIDEIIKKITIPTSEEFIKNELEQTVLFCKKLNNIRSNCLSIAIEFSMSDNSLYVKDISLKTNKETLLRLSFKINSGYKKFSSIAISGLAVNDDFLNDNLLHKVILPNSTIFTMFNISGFIDWYNDSNKSLFLPTLQRLLMKIMDNISDQISGNMINHVSPLRSSPQRYYFVDLANNHSSYTGQEGNGLAEILKKNARVLNKINTWLNHYDHSLKVTQIVDIIHSLQMNQKGIDLDLLDVGFGYSQVLPVIAQGFLAKTQSLTLVEQPETHLHPKMQADLADLFIDMTLANYSSDEKDKRSKYPKSFLIETHSEYLLKRLGRIVAEKRFDKNNIAIYFLSAQSDAESPTVIERCPVSEDGYFKYPADFLGEEMGKDQRTFILQQLINIKNG